MLNGGLPKQALASAVLLLTRVSSVEPDYDGLVSSFKHVIDGLVEIGILKSDKPSCIKSTYVWERGSRGHGKIKVLVKEAD